MIIFYRFAKNFSLIIGIISMALMSTLADVKAEDKETIAVIGTGDMGDSLGPRLTALGYTVVYGSRDPDRASVKALVQQSGPNASATTQKEAAQQGDIVILAVPWPAMETVAQNLGDLTGKIIIDIAMTTRQAEDGYEERIIDGNSGAEMIQGWNPGAHVVKTFATLGSHIVDDPMAAGGLVSVPIVADDPASKLRVGKLVAELGLDPVDAGPLRYAHEIEGLQMLYMVPLLQQRQDAWEFYFRRSSYWWCLGLEEYYDPVADKESLVTMPNVTGQEPQPCPTTSE